MIFTLGFLTLFLLLWALFRFIGPLLERLLHHSAHRLAAFRYRDYVPVVVVLAVGLGLTAAAGDGFVDLAEALQEGTPELHAVDAQVHEWARTTRTQGSTLFFTTMTLIGTPVGLGVLVLLADAALVARKRWRWAAYLAVTAVVGGLLNLQLKAYFARARPVLAEALRQAHGYSFPSGHAMGSTIVFGAFAYLAFRILRGWNHRAAALAFACTMIVSICISRIYLGVHWISDIAAGVCAGLVWLATTTVAYETFRRIRLVRSLRSKRAEKPPEAGPTS